MLHTQSRRYDTATLRYLIETTLHLDCGHKATFVGGESDIEKSLPALGVTVGSTDVSRCKECSARYKARLAEIINGGGMIGSRHA